MSQVSKLAGERETCSSPRAARHTCFASINRCSPGRSGPICGLPRGRMSAPTGPDRCLCRGGPGRGSGHYSSGPFGRAMDSAPEVGTPARTRSREAGSEPWRRLTGPAPTGRIRHQSETGPDHGAQRLAERQPFVCDGPGMRTLSEESARIDDEEDVSAQEARAEARARLHGPDGFEGRSACARSSSGQGAQAALGLTAANGARTRARAADAPAPRGLRGHRTQRPGARDATARPSLDANRPSRVADRALDAQVARRGGSTESSSTPAEGAGQGATGAHRSGMGPPPDRQAGRRRGESRRAWSRDRRAPGSVGDR